MKDHDSFGVHYILRRRNSDDIEGGVYAKISVNKLVREISMKHIVKVADWHVVKGLAKPQNAKLRRLNIELEEQRSKIISCYREIRNAGDLLTADAVKSRYLGHDNPAAKRTLLLLMEEYEKDQRPGLAHGSWKNYQTTYKYLHQFLAHVVPEKDVLIRGINHKFLIDLRNYIRENPVLSQKPATQNGLAKHLERLKRMVSWAREREWMSLNPVEAFKTPKVKSSRGSLEEEELKAIEQSQIDDPQIAYVRDLFIFACYTGVSYAGMMSLADNNLIHAEDGTSWITNQRSKTNIKYRVPLLPKPLAILEKYRANRLGGRLFRYISNQEMNRILKLVGLFCHLSDKLTFHKARHTFATIVTLAKGVPLESISSMLGHSNITTTQIYAKMVAGKVKSDMDELRRKLEGL